MRQDMIGKTLSWGVGFAIPLLFTLIGVVSILTQRSTVPMSQGMGRFALGATETSGVRAVVMGFAFLAFAAFLTGSFFHPLRERNERIALFLQLVGFTCGFVLFGYVLLFSRG